MSKKIKVLSVIGVCVFAGFMIYLAATSEIPIKDNIGYLCMGISLCCRVLDQTFTKVIDIDWEPNVEEKEQPEYIDAEDRIKTGNKMVYVGLAMTIIPLLALLILGELSGTLAIIAIVSFVGGIIGLIMGTVLYDQGMDYMVAQAEKDLAETAYNQEPESKFIIACRIIGNLAFIAGMIIIFVF